MTELANGNFLQLELFHLNHTQHNTNCRELVFISILSNPFNVFFISSVRRSFPCMTQFWVTDIIQPQMRLKFNLTELISTITRCTLMMVILSSIIVGIGTETCIVLESWSGKWAKKAKKQLNRREAKRPKCTTVKKSRMSKKPNTLYYSLDLKHLAVSFICKKLLANVFENKIVGLMLQLSRICPTFRQRGPQTQQ